jgi:hypothetical protein
MLQPDWLFELSRRKRERVRVSLQSCDLPLPGILPLVPPHLYSFLVIPPRVPIGSVLTSVVGTNSDLSDQLHLWIIIFYLPPQVTPGTLDSTSSK